MRFGREIRPVSRAVSLAVNVSVRAFADAAAMTTSTLPPLSAAALVRLSREWSVLSTRPALVRRARTWCLEVPFESLDDIVSATGFRADAGSARPGQVDDGDSVLCRLLVVARTDELAARVVLQRLVPGLVAVARKWCRRADTDPVEELVGAAWTVIRTYPVERRPRHLAARLLRDAEYHAFVRHLRRMAVHEPVPASTFDHDRFAVQPDDHGVDPAVELAELVHVARRTVLTERDQQLLALLLSGSTVVEMATALHVSVRSVLNHRDGLVSRLRQTARVLEAA